MTKTFAISGKGGTGKTTIAALLIKYFLSRKKLILAVDADPNSNLDSKLGVKAEHSIGSLREEVMKNIENIPPGISKSEWLEYKLKLGITEAQGFDLLTMGRAEGPGCYCYINQVLRSCVDRISEQYDYVVIDCEAGMEHLSRRTTRNVDILIIASDPTKEGILTAGRIKKLAEEMELKIKNYRLAINFMRTPVPEILKKVISDVGFEYKDVALIPYDENIINCSLENEPVINISEESKAYCAIEKLMQRIG
ncbi:MAG: AAA family ATPase [Candidatus Thermoplasmatota archaeon]